MPFTNYEIQNILEKFKIRNANMLSNMILYEDNEYFKYSSKPNNMIGGKCNKTSYLVEYKKKTFKFKCVDDEYNSAYSLKFLDSDSEYIIILIEHGSNLAYIHSIANSGGKYEFNKKYTPSGSLLLKVALELLTKYRKELKINRVFLKDNATKYCFDEESGKTYEKIILGDMLMLLNGDTWYGSYGFLPFEPNSNKPHDQRIELYRRNQKIIKKARIKDVHLYDYLLNASEETGRDLNMEKIKKYLKENEKGSLSKFLRDLIKNYDHECDMFSKIYHMIFKELKLISFYGMAFYLDLPK